MGVVPGGSPSAWTTAMRAVRTDRLAERTFVDDERTIVDSAWTCVDAPVAYQEEIGFVCSYSWFSKRAAWRRMRVTDCSEKGTDWGFPNSYPRAGWPVRTR